METYIPTIKTLLGKTKSELNAIFRNATEAAVSAEISAEERNAARQTVINCRAVMKSPHGPKF